MQRQIKVLIDCDVCLDVLSERQPHVRMSLTVFEALINKQFVGIISADSFTNIFYLLRKNLGNQEAVNKIILLRKISQVGSIMTSTIDSALLSGWTDFEDALQYQIAKENKCDYILTRNIADYKASDITVLTPSEFIDLVLHK